MRIGELSRRTGVPVPTIKYYIRDGLLPRGTATSHNQADYDDGHVRRIKLIRALIEVGELSIAHTRDLLRRLDESHGGVDSALGRTMDTLLSGASAGHPKPRDDDNWRTAGRRVDELIASRDWQDEVSEPVRTTLVGAVAAMYDLGQEQLLDAFDVYARAAEDVAEADLHLLTRQDSLDGIVESAVVGTILGEVLFNALRHIAHAKASAKQYPRRGASGRG